MQQLLFLQWFASACHTHFRSEIIFSGFEWPLTSHKTQYISCTPHSLLKRAKNVFISNKKSPHLSMCLISLGLLSYLRSFGGAIEGNRYYPMQDHTVGSEHQNTIGLFILHPTAMVKILIRVSVNIHFIKSTREHQRKKKDVLYHISFRIS